jgi:methylated-DNA-[protein]-cysteine S-methyltransferase
MNEHTVIASPSGPWRIEVDPAGRLARIDPSDGPPSAAAPGPALAAIADALRAYLAGAGPMPRPALVPARTPFAAAARAALLAVPTGSTISYSELAARAGRPAAVRAAARACATNPIAIVVPCHRVVGRDGALTGYAGGLERKRALLRLEGVLP